MPLFQYEAKNFEGRLIKGKMEATDESAVTATLRKMNTFPVKISTFKQGLNIDLADFKKVSIKDISIFCKQFSVIITAGITILRGLDIVKNQTENVKLMKMLTIVAEDVQKGKTLSAAMAKHKGFPSMLINMVEVGEASGTLDKVMERMAIYYEKEYKLRQKIKQALTYPVIVSIVSILILIFLVTVVIPKFIEILEGFGSNTLPLPTRMIIGLSNFVRYKWYIVIIMVIIIGISFKAYINSDKGRIQFDKLKLSSPIFGKIYRKIITARFARTFGLLMGTGVPLLKSVSISGNVVGNMVVKTNMELLKSNIKKGTSIGDSLAKTKLFPLMLTQMIKIGEESGTLDDVLKKTSDFYEDEVETSTAQLTSLIEPLIIVVLGGIVLFIILSVLLPMFSMYEAM